MSFRMLASRAAGVTVLSSPAVVGTPSFSSPKPVVSKPLPTPAPAPASDTPIATAVLVEAPVVAEVVADPSDLKAVIAAEVRAEARRYVSQRASGEIRAHLAQETTRQVEKVREGVSELVRAEVEAQVKAQVAVMLREDDALADLMDKQLMRVEQGVEGKAREVLDRLVNEERYQTIDASLRRNLEDKIHQKVSVGVLVIAASNALLLGALAMLLVSRK